ncbi:o-succinylbenzoate synthase [Pontibacillus yanchengensis]|uniref:o-succinylbenzoate synthase n=1 Tax=Pontibacillus yanchengensis Y32 TaxID=1385514 RepID=A0A0A2T8Z9_9BACI|nr:o-succinylbenzoate synthase [Pontibacillus yanchengensis]KGP72034.1 O-succinylbenzoate synthase [Pontibacillus yanchengensis Y32]
MNLTNVTLYRYEMNLVSPFKTHLGEVSKREGVLVEVKDGQGISGWGEGVAFSTPFYTGETVQSSWDIMIQQLLPFLKEHSIEHPQDVSERLTGFQDNQMAKAAIETAVWDVYAKTKQKPLSHLIGGRKNEIEVGVVLGLQDDIHTLLPQYKEAGYRRFKLKVEKGEERERIDIARSYVPAHLLMFDGNGAYSKDDMDHLKSLDDLGLMMIEQPFQAGDFYLHQQLQQHMNTPICLDESITSYHDAYQAIQLESCKVINIKIGRVGGLTEAIRIHDLCAQYNIPVWCGGMLETGISRAHNIALASLPNFTIPGDISASKRYWEKDVIIPEVELPNGYVVIPDGDGIGYDVDVDYISKITTDSYMLDL